MMHKLIQGRLAGGYCSRRLSALCTLMAAVSAVLLISQPAYAQDDFSSLADRLIQMRGEVDALQSELNIKREEHKNRMAYLTAQLSDLEANRDREQLRVRKLDEDLEEMRQEVASAGDTSETLAPIVLAHIDTIAANVRSGFPFKVGERLAALDEISNQLEGGVINAQRAVNRLWAFIEDEIRISRENAIYTQSINLDGKDILVDIAKIGTAMMFFRTRDKDYGRAVQGGSGWTFEMLPGGKDQEQAAVLFDSLRKQIRQGYFELPAALPMASESTAQGAPQEAGGES